MEYGILITRNGDALLDSTLGAEQVIDIILMVGEILAEKKVEVKPKREYKKKVKKNKKEKIKEENEDESEESHEPKKRLMPEDISLMKVRIFDKVSIADIAEEFGVSMQTVYTLKHKVEGGVI